ncbi:unnamed protein product [Protopolystoma xenopodis]|uniref:C2H2-type domain-containing protein n=1 Tax=Protopolystoma xenopodis TaxID=117903 RepID=A0A3S5AC75_9PLAT|nr:unnamed protein product [Protopolystoma xenopodis]
MRPVSKYIHLNISYLPEDAEAKQAANNLEAGGINLNVTCPISSAPAPVIPKKPTPEPMVCELCNITCLGVEAYAAHLVGRPHGRTERLHRQMGRPIPDCNTPLVAKTLTPDVIASE